MPALRGVLLDGSHARLFLVSALSQVLMISPRFSRVDPTESRSFFIRSECYLIFQFEPQSWHTATETCLNLLFELPLDFFHTRFDIPSVETAVIPRIALFVCPISPVLLCVALELVWIISIRVLAEWHFGQCIVWDSLSDVFAFSCVGYISRSDRHRLRISSAC